MYKFLGVLSVVLMSSSIQASDKVGSVGSIDKPNVIIFYVDDLGLRTTELNHLDEPTPWETPNMLELAKKGMNFTQAYSPAPSCSPSRGGLLSGQHPAKTNFTHVSGGNIPNSKKKVAPLVSPFYYEHLSQNVLTLAEALQENGYKTGHVGKWHLGKRKSNAPLANGFDFSYDGRGAHRNSDDRSKYFDDRTYPLSKEKYAPFSKKNPDGISYPLDEVTENALSFVQKNKAEPFFLYLAHWMVHVPIITKNRALLEHYTDKLGIPFPTNSDPITTPGHTNPFYGSMITTVDWSLGRLMSLLEKTDDPRNPGKKLIETTYIFFSSDNGGAELKGTEIITDNFPLDEGKSHVEEGGTRVPMVVSGPGVKRNVIHNGMVNQLDYYPTILALTDSKIDKEYKAKLSGLNLTSVFTGESKEATYDNGEIRKNLFWHFPHGDDSQKSAIREGDFKLHKNYIDNSYSLYRLYKDGKRFDIEEKNDLAKLPEYANVVKELSTNLERLLIENNALYPSLNPDYKGNPATRTRVPEVDSSTFSKSQRVAEITLKSGKSKLKEAYVLVQLPSESTKKKKSKKKSKPSKKNKSSKGITYIKLPVEISSNAMTVSANIPEGYEAYAFVLIDENNFFVSSDIYEVE